MKKSLLETNPYLKDPELKRKMHIRLGMVNQRACSCGATVVLFHAGNNTVTHIS
jgi:hypothetical protein